MNSWNISGSVVNFGVKGKKYPTLWVAIEATVHPNLLGTSGGNKNTVFVSFNIDADPESKKGKVAAYIQNILSKDKFVMVYAAMVTDIPFSKKGDDGEWETIKKPGLKAPISHLRVMDHRPADVNLGIVEGKVIKQSGTKVLVEERYRLPSSGEWKSRNIPLILSYTGDIQLVGKSIYTEVMACSTTETGDSKFHGRSKLLVVLS